MQRVRVSSLTCSRMPRVPLSSRSSSSASRTCWTTTKQHREADLQTHLRTFGMRFLFRCCRDLTRGRHGGAVLGAVASQQKGHRFHSRFRGLSCVEFTCSPWFSPGSRASCHSPKACEQGELQTEWLFVSMWTWDEVTTCPGCHVAFTL